MLFNSFEFVAFFLAVYALYIILRHRQQNILLLVASYVFYARWDWRFLSLIWISTLVDYFAGLALRRAATHGKKRLYLTISVVTNLGILFVFKYMGFFARSLQLMLGDFGFEADERFLNFVLPVGISFYTFQTMSYTIDIYRGRLEPTRNFLNFALFVAFFPQLVAGPIERAVRLLPQVEGERRISYQMIREGLWLLLLGYYQKVVLADNMTPFTRRVFEEPDRVHGLEILVAVYAFAFQIYGDFAGYSNIARGLAKLMGFDIMVNFRRPYFAVNPREFWQRWHISLSTWLRDYLYISLGGNRKGRAKTYRNLMLTMLLGGLWHGANWTFVAWGFFHGTVLCIHRAIQSRLPEPRFRSPLARQLARLALMVAFFQLTCVGWFLFAIPKLSYVPILFERFLSPFEVTGLTGILTVAVFAAPVVLIDWFEERAQVPLVVKTWRRPVRLAVYASLFAMIVLCGAPGGQEFIYFQF